MSTWIKSTGTLIYDPKRPGLKKKPEHWCIVKADEDLAGLYRWFIDKQMNPAGFNKAKLCQPSWGAHVSIIRGLGDLRGSPNWKERWKEHNHKKVDFYYRPFVRQTHMERDGHDDYWFVDVQCELGTQIRKDLGLRHDWNFHLTVGRTWT